MSDKQRLFTLREVSKLLNLNEEVLRRWLRSKRLPGIKIGSEWRVKENDLEAFLGSQNNSAVNQDNPQKMCTRFPMWLEYSGLPYHMNTLFGSNAWSVFKKLIEMDFEHGKPSDRKVKYTLSTLAARVGLTDDATRKILQTLEENSYISLMSKIDSSHFSIVSPIRTPKLVLDIEYYNGGVKGAPQEALNNSCLRRFLESPQHADSKS